MPQNSDQQKAGKLQNTVILSDHLAKKRAAGETAATQNPTPGILIPGDKVGSYQVEAMLGGGGMGNIYKAYDSAVNRAVALKVLPPHLFDSRQFVQRFQAEARTQARFNSPYITTLYGLQETSVGLILVMEYLEGQTLEQCIRRHGPLSMIDAIRIFEQVLLGVATIHHNGVIHRDLKPGNIFLTRDGNIKLLDFGVAELHDNDDPALARTMMGTLLYISPEQINGRKVDARSDIYTLGVSLYETVTGRLPFEKKSDYGLMHAHVQENPTRPSQYQRRLHKKLERIILKAIKKDPTERFQNAIEFRQALLQAWPNLKERSLMVAINNTGNQITPMGAAGNDPSITNPFLPKSSVATEKFPGGIAIDIFLISVLVSIILFFGMYPRELGGLALTTQQDQTVIKNNIVDAKLKAESSQAESRKGARIDGPVTAKSRKSSREPQQWQPRSTKSGKNKYQSRKRSWSR